MISLLNTSENGEAPSEGSLGQVPYRFGLLRLIREWLPNLSEQQRVIFALRYGAQFTESDIAQFLCMKRNTIVHQLAKAKRMLHLEMLAAGYPAEIWPLHRDLVQTAILTAVPTPAKLFAAIVEKLEAKMQT